MKLNVNVCRLKTHSNRLMFKLGYNYYWKCGRL